MRLVFRCDPALAAYLPRPIPARAALPGWVRAMQPRAYSPTHGQEVRTVKQCPPFIDHDDLPAYFGAGFRQRGGTGFAKLQHYYRRFGLRNGPIVEDADPRDRNLGLFVNDAVNTLPYLDSAMKAGSDSTIRSWAPTSTLGWVCLVGCRYQLPLRSGAECEQSGRSPRSIYLLRKHGSPTKREISFPGTGYRRSRGGWFRQYQPHWTILHWNRSWSDIQFGIGGRYNHQQGLTGAECRPALQRPRRPNPRQPY